MDEMSKLVNKEVMKSHLEDMNDDELDITPPRGFTRRQSDSMRLDFVENMKPLLNNVREKLKMTPSQWSNDFELNEAPEGVNGSEYQRVLNQNIKLTAFLVRLFRQYPV